MGQRYQSAVFIGLLDHPSKKCHTNQEEHCFQGLLTACCPGSDMADGFGKSSVDNGEKGLKVIVLSMFVFAVAVTVALFIQIAAGTRRTKSQRHLPFEIVI